MLDQKTIDRITVRELCNEASIHRGTFYRYYTDVYDLSFQIEEELYKKFETLILNSEHSTLQEIINRSIRLIYEEELVCRTLFRYKSCSDFYHKVVDMSRMHLYKQHPLDKLNDTETLYIFNCICAGVLGIIQTWINNNFQESPEQIIQYLERCMSDLFHTA